MTAPRTNGSGSPFLAAKRALACAAAALILAAAAASPSHASFTLAGMRPSGAGADHLSVASDGSGGFLTGTEAAPAALLRTSADGGYTWSDAPPFPYSDAPALFYAGGAWLAVWAESGGGCSSALSMDFAQTWSAPQPMLAGATQCSTARVHGSGAALHASIEWADGTDVVESSDGGASWTYSHRLTPHAGAAAPQRAAVSDGQGVWIAAWAADCSDASDIFYSRSSDDGASWSVPAQFLGQDAQPATSFDCEPIVIGQDGNGTWIVAWSSNLALVHAVDIDPLFARSTDGGMTWSQAAPLDSTTGVLGDDSPDTKPLRAIANDGADNWIVLYDFGGRAGLTQMYEHSPDGGRRWGERTFLDPPGAPSPLRLSGTPGAILDASGSGLVWATDLGAEAQLVWPLSTPCSPTPAFGCTESAAADGSRLSMRGFVSHDFNRIGFQMKLAPGFDYGSPGTGSGYAFCLYEQEGGTPRNVAGYFIPGDASCRGKACWRSSPKRAIFRDNYHEHSAIRRMFFRSSGSETRLLIGSVRSSLDLPPLPALLEPSMIAQLVELDGPRCWTAEFSSAHLNVESDFQAISD